MDIDPVCMGPNVFGLLRFMKRNTSTTIYLQWRLHKGRNSRAGEYPEIFDEINPLTWEETRQGPPSKDDGICRPARET